MKAPAPLTFPKKTVDEFAEVLISVPLCVRLFQNVVVAFPEVIMVALFVMLPWMSVMPAEKANVPLFVVLPSSKIPRPEIVPEALFVRVWNSMVPPVFLICPEFWLG